MECPICMECFNSESNCVITECNHSFHANCLMTHVAHNGFGCPCCRSEMAKEPEESVFSDDDDEESLELSPANSESVIWNTSNAALRGFRWMFQRCENELQEDDEEDVTSEPV